MFIDDQQGQIINITVVVEGATGQHLRSKCQSAFHSRSFRVRDSRCGRERESKTAGLGQVARPVNRSGFHSRRQNSWNWSSSMTRTGDSKESSGQVVLRHGPRAQVLREGERIRGILLKFTQDTG